MPAPALRSRIGSAATAAALAVAVLLLLAGPPRPAHADEGMPSDGGNRLDRFIVDVARLPPVGSESAPRLLVVDVAAQTAQTQPPSPQPDVVHLAVLSRDRSWEAVSGLDVDLASLRLGAHGAPWLIGVGNDRFALLVSSIATDRSGIVVVRTGLVAGASVVEEVARTTVDLAIDDAAAADVDGDGPQELVVASARTRGGGVLCQGSTIETLDPATLASRSAIEVPGRRLAGGVLGAFDDVGGADLLAYAHWDCPIGPTTPPDVGLVAVRLRDGAMIADLPVGPADADTILGAPLRFDVEGDGRDEAIARGPGGGLTVLVPASGWRREPLPGFDSLPLLAVDGAGNNALPRVAWLDPGLDPAGGSIQLARLTPSSSGPGPVVLLGRISLDLRGLGPERRDLLANLVRGSAAAGSPPVAWWSGMADPDCPDLILPGAAQPCGVYAIQPGAAWVATRPVIAYGAGAQRRLLVAEGVAWNPGEGLPVTPAPWAAPPAGWWRHGPSVPFALAEVSAVDATAASFRDLPTPQTTIDPTATRGSSTDLPGFTGTRFLVRARGLPNGAPDPGDPPSIDEALLSPGAAAEQRLLTRIATQPGIQAGAADGLAAVDLPDASLPEGSRPEAWTVTAVAINQWGELGPPARQSVQRDHLGPSVSLYAPFMSPLWPAPAHLLGAAEAGATVRVEGVGQLTPDPRGGFAFDAALAPWPQTFRIIGTDSSGNETVRDVSVVGGVDYRRFPWPAIVGAVLLAAVAFSGIGGSRRVGAGGLPNSPEPPSDPRRWRPAAMGSYDAQGIEIEDLPPGGGLFRG